MSLPGVGLLGLLRNQARTASVGEDEALTVADGRFGARSGAVRAVEHAVAAGSVQEPPKKVPQGRVVPPGAEYVFDVDVQVPQEAQIMLEVTPITMLHSEYEHKHHRQIAVNEQFICYGLKQGHIRVLSRSSADRQLCKGHSSAITDMRFAADGSSLLASGSGGGQLLVWRLEQGDTGLAATLVVHIEFTNSAAAGSLGDVYLAWGSGPAAGLLAAGLGGHVVLVPVPQESVGEKLTVDLQAPSGVLPLPGWPPGEALTSLAFTQDGQLLAAGGQAGTVSIWKLSADPSASPVPLHAAPPAALGAGSALGAGGSAAVGALQWLPSADSAAGWALVAGNANNSTLELWHSPAGPSPLAFSLLQRLKFECGGGPAEFFNHVEAVPQEQLLVVADTPKKAIYTLHYEGSGAACRLDYIARFGVGVPVLNLTACWGQEGQEAEAGADGDEAAVQLFCVQTTAVQMYRLDPQLCRPGVADVPATGRVDSPLERQDQQEASLPQPSSQLAALSTSGAPAAESELESTASAPLRPREDGPASPGAIIAQAALAAAAAAEAQAAAATAAAEGPGEGASTSSTALGEAESLERRRAPGDEEPGLSVEQEQEAGAEQLLQDEASIADRVSVLPSAPAFPAPPAEDAGGASPPSDLDAMSGIPTPEEPASPPSTPVAGTQISVQVPVPLPVPSERDTTAPEPTHVPQPHMTAGMALHAAPVLLMPGDVAPQPPRQHAHHSLDLPPERPLASAISTAASNQPQPSLRILQRPHAPPPIAVSHALSPRALAAASGGAALGPAVGPALGPSAAAAAAAAAPPPEHPAPTGLTQTAPAMDATAVGEAIAEGLGGAHKKFVGHVSLMYRELMKAMRTDMAAQQRQTEQVLTQLVTRSLEASAQQVQQERAAVLEEERRNIERLLVVVSTTLNQDLPDKLQETVRAEVAAVSGGLAAAVGPAVQQAIQASLPKELSTAVKSHLEKSLEKQLSAALAKPLQDAFRSSFQKSLLPAFEGACQAAFGQINAAMAAGFQEHVQAAKAAVEEPGALAAQLRESLASATALTAELRSERALLSQQLSRTASGVGGAGAPDVRAELSRDLKAGRYEEAFAAALGLQDLATVAWLCGQVEPAEVLSKEPCPLSQMVLLSLVQQLAADLGSASAPGAAAQGRKLSSELAWIREAAMLINPGDPLLTSHFRPVLEQVYSGLQACAAKAHGADASSCKLAMHVVHSQLVS